MGHLMVLMSLKLCNSNCFVSRCTQKIDPLFEDFEEMQSIFSMGHMKSRLDGMPSTFSDSSFGTVCLFLFVDCSSWPNLTAACAAQVAKQVVLSSFRHGNTLWRARCRFRNRLRGLVTILVHLYLCDLLWSYIHHNSCRKNRFLLHFCVSIQDIQGHSWRFTLFIWFWQIQSGWGRCLVDG